MTLDHTMNEVSLKMNSSTSLYKITRAMIFTCTEVTYVFSAIAVRQPAKAVLFALLEVSLIIFDASVMRSSLALMLEQKLDSLLSIAMGETLVEVSIVRGRAIVGSINSSASFAAFHPFPIISKVLIHKPANPVPLAELEISLIRGSIAILRSAMTMYQAILMLTNVHTILVEVDIFTEAMKDSCFPFAGVCFLAALPHVLVFPDAVYFSVNKLTLIMCVFPLLFAVMSNRTSCLVCSSPDADDFKMTFIALGILGVPASSACQSCLCVKHTLVFCTTWLIRAFSLFLLLH